MGGASSYIAMLCIAGFLGATWLATKVSKALGVSDIVLVITTGVVFGPDIIGLISKEYTVCEHTRHVECHDKDLAFKVANDLPLGEHLGRIAGMDYCHQEDYHHDDHHAEHADDHAGAHGMIGTHNASHNASHDAMHGNSSGQQHSDMEEHNSTEAGHAGSMSHDDGHVRRLAGGGNYHSYEECLEKSCEADISTQCQLTPDVFTLIGHAGVALMIFESGMHFDFEKAKIVGPKACVVAVLGTILPLITGTLLTMAYGKGFFPQGVSAGTALAPTSVGIALRLLGEAGVLQENFGQAIITAAFVDDILSLVLFNVLFSLGGAFDFFKVVASPIIGIVFMLIAMYGAMKFWPRFINGWLLPKIPDKEGAKVSRKDEVLFFVMIALLLAYGTVTHFLGTHLWGCFIAGMSFACLEPAHHAHHVWVKQTKRMTGWMIRIFFACTVAFSIPLDKLLSFNALWKGSIMGIGPCILTKVCCAPFMGDARWVIGWAMVGRAEFAYLIAQMAAAGGMLDQEMFSVVIWALLWATIFAPFIFRFVLNRYVRAQGFGGSAEEAGHGHEPFEDTYSHEGDAVGDQEYKMKMKSLDDIVVSTADVEAPSSRGPVKTDPSGSHHAALPNSDRSDASKCCLPLGRSSVL